MSIGFENQDITGDISQSIFKEMKEVKLTREKSS